MRARVVVAGLLLAAGCGFAETPGWLLVGRGGESVVRETVPLELAAGEQTVMRTLPRGAVPGSVVLRAPAGKGGARVVRQYVADAKQDIPGREATWVIDAPAAGPRALELTYAVQGVSWNGEYTLLLSPDGTSAAVQAAVHLRNGDDTAFQNVSVVLGSPSNEKGASQAAPPGMPDYMLPRGQEARGFRADALTPLPGVTELPAGTAMLVPVVSLDAVPVRTVLEADLTERGRPESEYYYEPGPGRSGCTVRWALELDNTEANGMGAALPAGEARVYRNTPEGPVLLGVARSAGTAPGGVLRLVVAEEPAVTVTKANATPREQMRSGAPMDISIEVANGLAEPREVRVYDRATAKPPIGGSGGILKSSDLYKELENGRVEFRVSVGPGEKRTITYSTPAN